MPRLPQLWSRATAAQEVYFSPDPRRRVLVAIAITLIAFPLSALGYGYFGPSSVAANLIAVAVVAGLFGLRAGVPYAVGAGLASAELLVLVGDARWPSIVSPGFLPMELAAIVVAVIAGRLHDVGHWLRDRQVALVESEARLRLMLDNLPVVLLAADTTGRFLFHAGAGLRGVGAAPAAAGDSIYERYRSRPEHIEYFERARAGEDLRTTIHWDGHEFESYFAPLRRPDGVIDGVVAIALDETERRKAQRAIEHLRQHDAVTGLPNRDQFLNSLERRIADPESRFVVIAIEIDNVHEVNDTHGHAAGDELLREIGLRVATMPVEQVARIGGTEFALAVSGELSRARSIASRLLTAIEAPVPLEAEVVRPVVSLGLSAASGVATASNLLRQATVAAETARRMGSTIAVYTSERDDHLPGRLSMAADLRVALENDGLTLAYQPIVTMADRTIVGVEALARWNHPTRGPVSPVDFVALAERVGLIRPLTDWVLRRAIADAREVLQPAGLEVSVNLSMRDLRDDQLPLLVRSLIGANGAAPALRLELTESAVMTDAQHAIGVVQELRHMGARIAIDDFGTGYSSLSYLQRLPVDTLKIDRSFVRDMYRDPASAAIIRAVIELARSMSLKVVAEGVETDATWDLLREWGCDMAQGYLIARPMPLAELRTWLAGRD